MKKLHFSRQGEYLLSEIKTLKIRERKNKKPNQSLLFLYQEKPNRKYVSSLYPLEEPNRYSMDIKKGGKRYFYTLDLLENEATLTLTEVVQWREKSSTLKGVKS